MINWLYENNYWIHFEYMDNFYYSTVDIIDSLPFASSIGVLRILDILKQRYIRLLNSIKKSLDVFRNNTYPNVKNPILFLCSIEELINNYMKSDEYEAYYFEKEDITLEIIKKEITQAKKLGLPLLINNKPGKLIEEYYQMYLQRLVLFNNSELIFDHEIDVEEKLGSLDVGNKNFIFVESSILKAKRNQNFLAKKLISLFNYQI